MDEFYAVVECLPHWLSNAFSAFPEDTVHTIHELRFKTGAPPMVTCAGKQATLAMFYEKKPSQMLSVPYALSYDPALNIPLTQMQIESLFYHLCGGCVHSYEEELAQGFFTLSGGHRVGVGGRYIPSISSKELYDAKTKNTAWQLQQVTSLNIRIARHRQIKIPNELDMALPFDFTSVIILGEPDSGKTTLLRSLVLRLISCNRTVAVIDERNELAVQGVDVIAGMEKSNAVQLALRTLSPEVIVLDELGTIAEISALEQGFFSGINFIAALHASSFLEAEQKPQFQYLQTHGMLGIACVLQGRQQPGCICETKDYRT